MCEAVLSQRRLPIDLSELVQPSSSFLSPRFSNAMSDSASSRTSSKRRHSRHRPSKATQQPSQQRTGAPPHPPSSQPTGLVPANLYSYSNQQSTWSRMDAAALSVAPPEVIIPGSDLSCLSYNTWSSNPAHSPFQSHSILRSLHKAAQTQSLGLISLQEVTQEFETLLRREEWVQQGWVVSGVHDYLAVAGDPPRGGSGWRGGVRPKQGGKEAVIILIRSNLVGQGSTVQLAKLGVPQGDRGRALVILDLHQKSKAAVSRTWPLRVHT